VKRKFGIPNDLCAKPLQDVWHKAGHEWLCSGAPGKAHPEGLPADVLNTRAAPLLVALRGARFRRPARPYARGTWKAAHAT
jgi:hypothetical protein